MTKYFKMFFYLFKKYFSIFNRKYLKMKKYSSVLQIRKNSFHAFG